MRLRALLLGAVATLVLVIPIEASADDCPHVFGSAVYDFGNGIGVASLEHDGEHVFVPITPGTFEISYPFVTRVTYWDFPGGTVEMTEEYELIPVGPNFYFESDVAVTGGGTGLLTWKVVSVPMVGLNAIRQISGAVCVD